jgi:hypothetical protein
VGTRDHDAALAAAKDAFDNQTRAIENDTGLDEDEKEAIFALTDKVRSEITDDKEGLEKGLKVGKIAYGLFKDPLALLGKVGGILGL